MNHANKQTDVSNPTKPRPQGSRKSPDMKSHNGAGSSTQEELERRSNETEDEDIDDIDDPIGSSDDADIDEPKEDEDIDKRIGRDR